MESAIPKYKFQFLNEFALKIIAIITMTFDHVGALLCSFNHPDSSLYLTGYIFRIIGRIALPLFIYMLVEGMVKSKHRGRYLLRLAIMAVTIDIAMIFIYYFINHDNSLIPAFNDLLINGAILYFLLHHKKNICFLAILPLLISILSFGVDVYETLNPNIIIEWFPFYLRGDYSLFATLLTLGIYLGHYLAKKKTQAFLGQIEFDDSYRQGYYQVYVNIIGVVVLLLINVIIYFLSYLNIDPYYSNLQTWSIFAGLIYFFYNGKRGYDAKWFKYSSYIYYPVHIIIIYFIFYLIYM